MPSDLGGVLREVVSTFKKLTYSSMTVIRISYLLLQSLKQSPSGPGDVCRQHVNHCLHNI